MPYLPIALSYGDQSIEALALLDTGASVNALLYEAGLQLGAAWKEQIGAAWKEQKIPIQLSGNLA